MTGPTISIVGAAESQHPRSAPEHSALHLATDAARRALADAGLGPEDVDGLAITSLQPYTATWLAQALGIEPSWTDSTMIGGCSALVHVRHAAAAIAAGQCTTVLIAHGESGRSRIGAPGYRPTPDSMQGQFEVPYGTFGPMTLLTLGARRWLRDRSLDERTLAEVVVAQRRWASHNPRAVRRDPITLDEVLDAPPVALPFTRPMCCVVTDGGGALVVTSRERAHDMVTAPVDVIGTGEALETAMVSQMDDLTSSRAFRRSGAAAMAEADVTADDLDHAMLYDAIAYLPLLALEDLGLVAPGEAGAFVADGQTAPGGSLPTNTNGGGLNDTHTGMYGMFAIQESVRQLRGRAAAQVPGVATSLVHGIGGMFQGAATLVLSTP